MKANLARRLAAEAIGTGWLVAAVIGSGIMGQRLAGGNVAVALLANTIATGAALTALILTLGPISGGHLNPVVTLSAKSQGESSWHESLAYISVQLAGAVAGAMVANIMFGESPIVLAQHPRSGATQLLGEFVATFGLLLVVRSCAKFQTAMVPFAVGAYITAAYWFTSSTSFANPAVTLARSLSDTFAGIRPSDVPPFVIAQLAGAAAATLLARWLIQVTSARSEHE